MNTTHITSLRPLFSGRLLTDTDASLEGEASWYVLLEISDTVSENHAADLPHSGIYRGVRRRDRGGIPRYAPGRLRAPGRRQPALQRVACDRSLRPGHAAEFLSAEEPLNKLVRDAVDCSGGSISAKHSLGVSQRDEAARYKSPLERKPMHAMKQALDPKGLMNPGKFIVE